MAANENVELRRGSTLSRLFWEQIHRTPLQPALFHNGKAIPYKTLGERANAIAEALVENYGIGPDDRVFVCLERSPDAVAALLGILKTGAAYVPVDPATPAKRLVALVITSKPSAIVATAEARARLPEAARTLCLDLSTVPHHPGVPVADHSSPDGIAYVIHTSGSTGEPKGVEGLHRGTVNRFRWMWRKFPFAAGEVACLKTSAGFVDAVWETLGALLAGHPSLVVSAETAADPRALLEALSASGVTRMVVVPSLLRVLLDSLESDPSLSWPDLRICVSSGETLPLDLVGRFRSHFPSAKLLNLYGSSEVSADVTCFDTDDLTDSHTAVPLGKPIDNTRIYILDDDLRPNGTGEICVAGESLARGYFGRKDLTAAAFVSVELPGVGRERLYRTGDLGGVLPDGNLEYLGRRDHQIKIRGVRIEPREIETALLGHRAVARAHVRLVQTPEGDRLFAYVTATRGQRPDSRALLTHLRRRLPATMLPHHIVVLEHFPLTASGKLDGLALPTTASATSPQVSAVSEGLTRTELSLAELWGRILGTAPEQRDAHFLERGGDSLGLMALSAAIQRAFGRHLPMRRLVESPTLAAMAAAIDEAGNDAEWHSLATIRSEGSKHPIFLVHGIGGGILWGYRNLAAHLDPERPVYAFSSRGLDGLAEFDTPAAMAAQYLRDMKTVQPEGPYLVGGYCFGGNIAYEICRQLREQGDSVSLCLIFDAYPFLHARSGRKLELHSPVETCRFGLNFLRKASHLVRMSGRDRREHLARIGRWLRWRVTPAVRRSARRPGLDDAIAEAEQEASTLTNLDNYSEAQAHLWSAHVAMHSGWVDEKPTGGPLPLALFRTDSQPVFSDYALDFGWSKLTGASTRIAPLSGHHDFIFLDPHVASNARAVNKILDDLP